ncbi:hypothetical protein D3C71_1864930 [compost metagenome]
MPWRSRRREASRTGARLIAICRAISASTTRLPGGSLPCTIAWVSLSSTTPTRSGTLTDSNVLEAAGFSVMEFSIRVMKDGLRVSGITPRFFPAYQCYC